MAAWLGFARLVGRPISSDKSFDLRAELEAFLGTSPPSALHPFDIAVDDAHLLTAHQLDVLAEVATRYRCVFGVHPGEAKADELLGRFEHARLVVPEIDAAQELRTLLASLGVASGSPR